MYCIFCSRTSSYWAQLPTPRQNPSTDLRPWILPLLLSKKPCPWPCPCFLPFSYVFCPHPHVTQGLVYMHVGAHTHIHTLSDCPPQLLLTYPNLICFKIQQKSHHFKKPCLRLRLKTLWLSFMWISLSYDPDYKNECIVFLDNSLLNIPDSVKVPWRWGQCAMVLFHFSRICSYSGTASSKQILSGWI